MGKFLWSVAQLAERRIVNPWVPGSSPGLPATTRTYKAGSTHESWEQSRIVHNRLVRLIQRVKEAFSDHGPGAPRCCG